MKIFFSVFLFVAYLIIYKQGAMALEEGTYFNKKQFQFPVKEYSLISSDTGFYPNKIILKEGEKLRLFFTSLNKHGCFFMAKKNIFLSSKANTISEKEIYFEKSGIYKFNCPSNNSMGEVIVLKIRKNKVKRKIASRSKVKIWMPKEY